MISVFKVVQDVSVESSSSVLKLSSESSLPSSSEICLEGSSSRVEMTHSICVFGPEVSESFLEISREFLKWIPVRSLAQLTLFKVKANIEA